MLLYEIVDKAVEQTPDKVAVICANESCTYTQLSDMMDLWAKTLLSLGVRRGDRVALFMKNRVELVGLYFACFRIGVIAVPLNTRYQTPEAVYGLEQSGSRILLTSSELFPIVENLDKTISSLENIYIIDEDQKYLSTYPSISWSKISADAIDPVSFPDVNITDPALIIYTSGSTGKPKGVIYTHDTYSHLIMMKKRDWKTNPDDSVLVSTQISHVAGLSMVMLFLESGGTAVMMEEFEAGGYIRLLDRYKPTLMGLLPT